MDYALCWPWQGLPTQREVRVSTMLAMVAHVHTAELCNRANSAIRGGVSDPHLPGRKKKAEPDRGVWLRGTMLTPAEVEDLRRDKRESAEIFRRLYEEDARENGLPPPKIRLV